MTLIRAIGRTMLASYFIASGIKTARNPTAFVEEAQPLADKIVPAVQKYAPRQIAGFLPDDTVDIVRLSGISQAAGGLMLATGKGRRLGAWMLASTIVPGTLARHPFWSVSDPDQKAIEKTQFLKNISLLGGVLIAARDTEGQPGLRWRAASGAHSLSKSGKSASKSISKGADSLSKNAEAALAGGAVLAGGVLKQSRRARRKAAKAAKKTAKKTAKRSGKLSEAAAKKADKLSAKAEKSTRKTRRAAKAQAKEAKKAAEAKAKQLKKRGKKAGKNIDVKSIQNTAQDLQSSAQSFAKDASKEISHRAADARKTAEKTMDKVAKNIELGHN